MADTAVTIRIDEDIKRRFGKFCADVGVNMSVAVNMFIRASLKDQHIPFVNESPKAAKSMEPLRDIRAEAESRGFLSDEEIEAEIQVARTDIKARKTVIV